MKIEIRGNLTYARIKDMNASLGVDVEGKEPIKRIEPDSFMKQENTTELVNYLNKRIEKESKYHKYFDGEGLETTVCIYSADELNAIHEQVRLLENILAPNQLNGLKEAINKMYL